MNGETVLQGNRPGFSPPSPKRKLFACMLIGGVLSFGMMSMCLIASALPGAAAGGSVHLVEERVEGQGGDKVALIELNGVIMTQVGGGFLGGGVNLVNRLKQEFDKAAEDSDVKGVLFVVDSPGGMVTTSDQIWHMVGRFRKKTGKPVVVHMGSMCASGGYYIAVAANYIVSEPTTITGSIGVLMSGMNFSGLLKEYGVADVTITSGPNKDLLNSTAPIRQEHREIIQSMVDDTYERFVDLIVQGRPLEKARVKTLADGRIYTAKQALEHKLVDQIGYREDSFAQVKKLAGVEPAKLVRYKRPLTLAEALSGQARALRGPTLQLDLSLLEQLRSPRLMALWRPE